MRTQSERLLFSSEERTEFSRPLDRRPAMGHASMRSRASKQGTKQAGFVLQWGRLFHLPESFLNVRPIQFPGCGSRLSRRQQIAATALIWLFLSETKPASYSDDARETKRLNT